MNILLLTYDIDGPGVGFDAKYSKEILDNGNKFFVIHYGLRDEPENRIFRLNKKNIVSDYFKFKKIIIENKIDLTHVRGLMSIDHIRWFFFLILINAKYVISINSQLNTYNLQNKLFFKDPDIQSMVSNNKNDLPILNKFLNLIKTLLIPFLKVIYLKSIGSLFLNRSKGLILFSEYELNFLKKFKVKKRIIYEPIFLPIKNNYKTTDSFNYNKNFINIVYWGRIDFKMKGIDRIIDFSKKIQSIKYNNNVQIHFMGPDYNDGLNILKKSILENNLENNLIIHSKEVWSKSDLPLKKADYCILLSRWDGFPRSLRESIYNNVPIIISKETNFFDIVSKTGCGVMIDETNPNEIEHFIKILVENKKNEISKHKKNCIDANKLISNKYYKENIIKFYNEI